MNKENRKKISIIGTCGIPNKYGGFEELAENLVKYLSNYYDIKVFCSSRHNKNGPKIYNGARLKYLPLKANGIESIFYDLISLLLSVFDDKILLLGCSGGLLMPFLFFLRKKIILNIGGLEWQRSKWPKMAQKFLKISERVAIYLSKVIVSDNKAIKEYIKNEYGRDSYLIEYGGDTAFSVTCTDEDYKKYPFLKKKYALGIARIQEDNNVEIILKAFLTYYNFPIVFIGNWDNSRYGRKLFNKYKSDKNIILLESIYDKRILNLIRSNCYVYLHGHSAGGTNPSLVEIMYLGKPIIAYASKFNLYTTENKALYFYDLNSLIDILNSLESINLDNIKEEMKKIAEEKYKWEIISNKYKILFDDII